MLVRLKIKLAQLADMLYRKLLNVGYVIRFGHDMEGNTTHFTVKSDLMILVDMIIENWNFSGTTHTLVRRIGNF